VKLIRSIITSLLTVTLLGGTPMAFAHDELGDVSVEKGQHDQYETVPTLQGSKNFKYLTEVAAVPLKERKPGVRNTGADVYAHKGFAYMGTHVANGAEGGVRIFDLKDPANPVEVAVMANDLPGTWQEKVIVKSINTPYFKGDLAAVSVQKLNRTSQDAQGGFALYDVTNPYEPKKLGFWELDSRVRGTHELYLTQQGGRALVLTANPYADYYTHGETKDFAIVDVTDPTNPTTIYQFDPRTVGGVPQDFNGYHWKDESSGGKIRPVFAHSVKTDENGTTAYVSMWDLGTIIFDIRDPENPKLLGRTSFEANVQGAAHSSALAKGGTILIETREVYQPTKEGYESSYGYTRIYDIKDKTNPVLISTFKTELVDDVENGVTFANTVHDPKVHGNTLYLSHYAGGVRIVDITDPSSPKEIGVYVPENSDVWGVFVDRNYILASDIGTGLKVLQKRK